MTLVESGANCVQEVLSLGAIFGPDHFCNTEYKYLLIYFDVVVSITNIKPDKHLILDKKHIFVNFYLIPMGRKCVPKFILSHFPYSLDRQMSVKATVLLRFLRNIYT